MTKNAHLSTRVQNISESKSILMSQLLSKLKGRPIISLNVGEPDLGTHQEIISATQNALSAGQTRYSLVPGLASLRESIAQKVTRENKIPCQADNILVSNGSKQILYNLFQIIIDPDDEVIVPIPYWVSFPESIKLAGGRPIFVPTDKNHQLDLEAIKMAITNKTKAIVVNSPNNPTGAVYSRDDLYQLAQLATEHDFLIISDEAYEDLVYEVEHVSPASFSTEIFKRTLTVQTFSKSYCMTGYRLGYLVADTPFIESMQKLQGHLTGNNCTFSQFGALKALELRSEYTPYLQKLFQERRDLAYNLFSPLFPCVKPAGAFYLFCDIRDYLENEKIDCDQFVLKLLEEANVACLSGASFGLPGFLRIAFTVQENDIIEAAQRMKRFLCK